MGRKYLRRYYPELEQIINNIGEVEVEDRLLRGVRRGKVYPKKCYEKAHKYVLENGDVESILEVHGYIVEGIVIPHAWVELPGDKVFDGAFQAFFDKCRYYMVRRAVKEVEYTAKKAVDRLLSEGHYGPWHLDYYERIAIEYGKQHTP